MDHTVYITDLVYLLMQEVLEYVGEVEHVNGLKDLPKSKVGAARDFALYLAEKYHVREVHK